MSIHPRFEMCGTELNRLGLSNETVRAAYDALDQQLGAGWLSCLRNPRSSGLFRRHPLVQVVSTGSTSSVIDALELQVSLAAFRTDPALPGLIRDLKEPDHFDDFYFALRCAFAVKRMGWSVELEPDSEEGSKADFVARSSSQTTFFECRNIGDAWAPRVNTLPFENILSKQPLPARDYAIDLTFKSANVPGQSDKIRRELSRIVTDFINNPADMTYEDSEVSLRISTLSGIERRTILQNRDSQTGWDYVHSYVAEGTPFGILVRISEPAPIGMKRGIEALIDRHIREKHDQIRLHPENAGSALLLGINQDIGTIDSDRLAGKIRENHFKSLPRLSILGILQRRWNSDGRYRNAVYLYRNVAALQVMSDLHINTLSEALQSDLSLPSLIDNSSS